jgi:Flp pilus assembly protein TadD
LTRFSDPAPDDLLVANQVRAIESSECFVQSRQAFSCTACHDPHSDSTDDTRAVKACMGCHGSDQKAHAAICPVNARSGCVGCHMPSVDMGALHLVDHLIRVHPEQKTPAVKRDESLRTQITPVSEYLRLIAENSAEGAASALDRLRGGESFYKAARETSVDHSADIGGFLGRKELAALPPAIAREAARLGYGERSGVIPSDGKWFMIERLPRDFRWEAEQLEKQAEDFAARGDAKSAINKAQEALMIDPQFLRAIRFIGLTFAQNGNPKKAEAVLATAARLYPDDATTQFALGAAREALDDKVGARAAYQRAIELEPDFTAAYERLGMADYSAGDLKDAMAAFRQGLQVDPLSAELNYDLGLALRRTGDIAGADQATSLANRLAPNADHQPQ